MLSLDDIYAKAQSMILAANNLTDLDHCRVAFLGKKGQLTEYLKNLGSLPSEQRPLMGQKVNSLKTALLTLIDERNEALKAQAIENQLKAESVDITLPGRKQSQGSMHPISQTVERLKLIFAHMGFSFMEGPEVEEDYYNFTALNIPPFHPARAMQDTFYLTDGKLLRSQMSPVQIHAMNKTKPPLRMVALGKVYRHDFDITHTPMFHQMECLLVDEQVSFANLKGLLKTFLQTFFEVDLPIRFRPSYFPFTEPSAEVDIACFKCSSKGCRICKYSGWLEVLGAGMVHPNVLNQVGIDSEKYRGFAFGVGLDRLALLKFGISDLRALFENDLRFLKQF